MSYFLRYVLRQRDSTVLESIRAPCLKKFFTIHSSPHEHNKKQTVPRQHHAFKSANEYFIPSYGTGGYLFSLLTDRVNTDVYGRRHGYTV